MSSAGLATYRPQRSPAAVLAGLCLFAAACDEGVDRRARDAVNRAKMTAQTTPPGPAEEILQRHRVQMGEIGRAYDLALKAAGYGEALGEAALTSSEVFALAPARLAAAKKAAQVHRDRALFETDAAIAAFRDLSAKQGVRAPIAEKLTKDLAAMRTRRESHWSYTAQIMDETHAAWRTLDEAEGDWGLEADGLKFTGLKDKEAYDAHAARIGALVSRQQRLIAEQEVAAADLASLARLYGR